jgi:site-specific recombinase XerD
MRVECRKLANGEQYFSFVYAQDGKRVRLKKESHPLFKTRAEAEQWAKAKEAEFECHKARIIRRLQWKTQFYEFTKISENYIEDCKKTQPNSWRNTEFYLHHYILPYFLEIKKSNNPNNWSLHFEDFKNWLENEAVGIKRSKRLISYATKNHCIKTLNTLLTFLMRQNLVEKSNVYKMTAFPGSKINRRDASSLIPEEEFRMVHQLLKDRNPVAATFFETAYWTGMRFSEIFGLSIDDLFPGDLDDSVLSNALIHHQIPYFGYIVLESQPAKKIRDRMPDGSIQRKPLKGKPKIGEKHNRIIPIVSKELFNNLVRFYKIQKEKFDKRNFGSNPKDYVLFEELTQSDAVVSLRETYGLTKFQAKSYHCCRHTRCTELVGKTRDFVLAQMWLGHARQETTLHYTHIYQQSVRIARKKIQKIDFVD